MYGMEHAGKKETIALHLYSLFDVLATDDEPSATEEPSVAGPSSTGEQGFIPPNQPQTLSNWECNGYPQLRGPKKDHARSIWKIHPATCRECL